MAELVMAGEVTTRGALTSYFQHQPKLSNGGRNPCAPPPWSCAALTGNLAEVSAGSLRRLRCYYISPYLMSVIQKHYTAVALVSCRPVITKALLPVHSPAADHLRRQVTLFEQQVIGFLIDMVERKWIKSTNEIKAVLLFCEHTGDITGVHESEERQ